MKIVISSGHSLYVRGAEGPPPWGLDEVDEARRVVNEVGKTLRYMGHEAITFHDDISKSQNENLKRIVDFHNAQDRDLDVSVHFNANVITSKPIGCEVLYVSSKGLEAARPVVDSICAASGLINRGPKERTNLYFLNETEEPAILIETCFVDSQADAGIYNAKFIAICDAIALGVIAESGVPPIPPEVEEPGLFRVRGKCSWFGGETDTGVSPSEGLAFIFPNSDGDPPAQSRFLFYPEQPSGTSGLARRLNSEQVFFAACRWDYSKTPKEMLANPNIMGVARANSFEFYFWPADWGPHGDTNRVVDLSIALMSALDVTTDEDDVEIIYPYSPRELV